MAISFDDHSIQLYSNFMKYTISNPIYNIILILIENATFIYIIDLMFHGDNILSQTFTIFNFLSPHLYLDMFNEQFSNECDKIFQANSTNSSDLYRKFTGNPPTTDIIFFGYSLYSTKNAYCVYSTPLFIIIICIVILITMFFIGLFFINTRPQQQRVNPILHGITYVLTNCIILFTRPFLVMIMIVLVNRPLILLYKYSDITSDYLTTEIILTVISLIFFLYFIIFTYINFKYINNTFYFESFPYDYFTLNETMFMMIIKIVIAFKINFDKLLGINAMNSISLIIGVFVILKAANTIGNQGYYINHVYLRILIVFLSLFDAFYIIIKLINEYVKHFKEYSIFSHITELSLMFIVLWILILFLFTIKTEFSFETTKKFLIETLQFFYYIHNKLALTGNVVKKKQHRNQFIDNVLIGHKMKCKIESCTICEESFTNPDLRTLCGILYNEFSAHEKEYKEENEGLLLQIKLMFIRLIDEENIHRVAFIVLKNLKNKNISYATFLKINFLYRRSIDELNRDLKGLLRMKYSQVYDDLLDCIKNFEDILGFIKSHTEKVKLVINKMNNIGNFFRSILKDLLFLKRNKRIYYDPPNLLQIICVIRVIFHKNVDPEISNSLDYNVHDFLEIVDCSFTENFSFLIKYDFNNKTWRIMKIPKRFIDNTHYKISELLDQSIEKIFPKSLAKTRMRKMEDEILLSNHTKSRIQFKTLICDAEGNVKYVSFIIDIIPHLENSYLLYMQCHFHKRQLIIIDERGNFVNGSNVLYDKVGINSEIVASSKGRINMYTLFNIEKKSNLEEIRTVYLCDEGVNTEMKKLFLLDNSETKKDIRQTVTPGFLDNFLFNSNNSPAKKKKKGRTKVFFSLFEKETVNDLKYYIYNIKLLEDFDVDKEKKILKNWGTTESGKRRNNQQSKRSLKLKLSALNVTYSSTKNEMNKKKGLRKINSAFPINDLSSDDELKEFGHKDNEMTTLKPSINNCNGNYEEKSDESDKDKKNINNPINTPTNINNTIKNNTYKDNSPNDGNYNENIKINGNRIVKDESTAALITKTPNDQNNSINNNPSAQAIPLFNLESSISVLNSTNYDIFSYLHMKIVIQKTHSIKFGRYLYAIFSMNLCMILYSLSAIIFIEAHQKSTIKLINIVELHNKISLRFSKATFNFLTIMKYKSEASDSPFQDYINNTSLAINYDQLLKKYLEFDSLIILEELTAYFSQSFDYFNEDIYLANINLLDFFIHLAPSGNYSIRIDNLKVIFDIFVLTINQLANQKEPKLYLNISYLEYTYTGNSIEEENFMHLTTIDVDKLTLGDKNYFIERVNIYQHFFNYFNSYFLNNEQINSYFKNTLINHIRKMHITSQILIELLSVLNIIFVLFLCSSIVFYKNMLQKEFAELYSLNEESINKMKEKYAYVKALIKWEQAPSKLYGNIRQMRSDITQAELENKQRAMNTTKKIKEDDDEKITAKYINFSGAINGEYRSNTIRTKEIIAKEGIKEKEDKVNLFLLKRLNFDFDIISELFHLIILMTLAFLSIGLFSIGFFYYMHDSILDGIEVTNLIHSKLQYLYNYSNANKLSIIFNKESPYTLFEGYYGPFCMNCSYSIFTNYSHLTDSLNTIEERNSQVEFLTAMETNFNHDNICKNLYSEFKSNFMNFISKDSPLVLESLQGICIGIPIFHSTVESILSETMILLRKRIFAFKSIDKNIETRIDLLNNEFLFTDLIVTLFGEFYQEYLYDNFVNGLIEGITRNYFSILLYLFLIVIILDLLMILVIWTKIYKQILSSVNDVQLVTDSVSCI